VRAQVRCRLAWALNELFVGGWGGQEETDLGEPIVEQVVCPHHHFGGRSQSEDGVTQDHQPHGHGTPELGSSSQNYPIRSQDYRFGGQDSSQTVRGTLKCTAGLEGSSNWRSVTDATRDPARHKYRGGRCESFRVPTGMTGPPSAEPNGPGRPSRRGQRRKEERTPPWDNRGGCGLSEPRDGLGLSVIHLWGSVDSALESGYFQDAPLVPQAGEYFRPSVAEWIDLERLDLPLEGACVPVLDVLDEKSRAWYSEEANVVASQGPPRARRCWKVRGCHYAGLLRRLFEAGMLV
jgi:hypothetical protein